MGKEEEFENEEEEKEKEEKRKIKRKSGREEDGVRGRWEDWGEGKAVYGKGKWWRGE